MTIDEFKILINRELDGEISPEDEAALMHEVSRNSELEREYRAQHALRDGFKAMERPVPPAHLAERVADRVLAGGRHNRFLRATFPMAQRAALFLVVLTLGIATGIMVASNEDAIAGDGEGAPTRIDEALRWQEILDLTENQLSAWRAVRADHQKALDAAPDRSPEDEQRLTDAENAAKLRILTDGQREAWRKHAGVSPEEVKRLLRLGQGR